MKYPPFHRPLAVLALVAVAACSDRTAGADPVPRSADTRAAVSPADSDVRSAPDSATEAPVVAEPVGPPAPLARAPDQIRGIYLNAYAAGSRTRLPRLMDIADRTEINTFVIDVKTERGIHYSSETALARELQQEGENTLRNMATLVDTLHGRGILAIARIVVFKDPIVSQA